jgi:hypothetical protein
LDGRVLVAGGTNNGTIVNFVEQTSGIYDPATNSWSAGGNLQKSRSAHTATLLADGRVLLVGGFDGGSNNTAEIFDPATNSWTLAQNMSDDKHWHHGDCTPRNGAERHDDGHRHYSRPEQQK